MRFMGYKVAGLLVLTLLAIVTVGLSVFYGNSLIVHISDECICNLIQQEPWEVGSIQVPKIKIILNSTTTPKIFHCRGYALNRNFHPTLRSLFHEYEWVDLSDASKRSNFVESNPWDLFVSNWKLDECKGDKIHRWLQLSFRGKVLFLNPEDTTYLEPPIPRSHYFELGPGSPRPNRWVFFFLQAAFWAQMDQDERQVLINPSLKPRNTGKHFLVYAHSHCVGIRQAAFRRIANLGLGVAYYAGRCDGGVKSADKAQQFQNSVRLKNWEENRHVYKEFRFCLTMEHVRDPGYITEKILVAFWAGCIPIYYGTTEIFDVFNSKAFIYYDVDNSQPALDRIRYLETNRSAYEETLRQPILSERAVEKYLSLDSSLGGGNLKAQIRSFLGLNVYDFK